MRSPTSNTLPRSAKTPYDSLTLRAVVVELRSRLLGGVVQDVRQPIPTELLLGIRSQGRNFLLALSDDARFARVHLTATRSPNAPTPPTFCMTLRKHLEGGVIRDLRQRDFDRIFEMEVEAYDEGVPTTVTLIAELMGKHSNLILVTATGTILDAAKRITRRVNRLREILPGLPYQSPPEQTGKSDPFAAFPPLPLTPSPKGKGEETSLPVPLLSKERGANASLDLLSQQSEAEANLHAIVTPFPLGEGDGGRGNLAEFLLNHYAGMSPFLAQEMAARAAVSGDESNGLAQVWESIFGAAARGEFHPILARDSAGQPIGAYPFSILQWPQEAQESASDFNLALDAVFTAARERADFEAAAGDLQSQLTREIKRLVRQQQSLERTLSEAQRAGELKQSGELILANLWRIQPGEASVMVQDYYDPALPDRTLALDSKLSPQENAELYFRRYRKARDGQEVALEQGVRVAEALQRLQDAQTQLAATQTAEEVRSLRTRWTDAGLLRATDEEAETKSGRSGPDFEGHKIRRFTTPEGYEIYYGETATANDFLTTRVAAPNDIWLHVRAATSAHVLIRTRGRPADVPRSVLMQAALLCARHSSQKHSSLVAVDYTLKKYVRKPRGAAPGSADYEKETTLEVTPSV